MILSVALQPFIDPDLQACWSSTRPSEKSTVILEKLLNIASAAFIQGW